MLVNKTSVDKWKVIAEHGRKEDSEVVQYKRVRLDQVHGTLAHESAKSAQKRDSSAIDDAQEVKQEQKIYKPMSNL